MSRDRNTIYIGRKPVMSYVLAVITHFNASDVQEATLKARGRAITTAVDVAEVTRRRFLTNVKVSTIEIGTEVMPEEGGRSRAVSTIAVKLALAEQATS
jgi:DNA-binding protein Alba